MSDSAKSVLSEMSQPPRQVVLITGPSGAGRTTALNVFEDLGFERIDNLPLSLVPRILAEPLDRPLALGVDVRTRDFSAVAMLELLDRLPARDQLESQLVFLDASMDVLIRRFSETRRRHPLAPEDSPRDGIDREFGMLEPLRDRADLLIDTSEMSPHDLRRELTSWFAVPEAPRMALSLSSFSYKRGLPRGADLVFDCRFLRNPHWEPDLRDMDGRDDAVQAYVAADDSYAAFFERLLGLLDILLPAYVNDGKAHLTVAMGCTGGQHRSVAVTEHLRNALANKGWHVSIGHRELDSRP